MKKVLFVATVDSHIRHFHLPYLEWFSNQGYTVHVATNGNERFDFCDVKHVISFERSPYNFKNIKAYFDLKKIITEEGFEIVHCHTPMGGVLTRLASRKSRARGTRVIYTAHGFHFYKGASIKNWILYYPVEKFLSKYTDTLITINKEDYNLAIKESFKFGSVKLIDGVGVNLSEFNPQTNLIKRKLRKEYNYNEEDFILIYVAEMVPGKNQEMLISVMNELKNKIQNLKLLLVGTGEFMDQYSRKVDDMDLSGCIDFLGYRNDVPDLMKMADVSVSSSRREGLPVNIMESMATGLPLVVSNCRGNRDLIKHKENGFVVDIDDVDEFAEHIHNLYKNKELREKFKKENLDKVSKYEISKILDEMIKMYSE